MAGPISDLENLYVDELFTRDRPQVMGFPPFFHEYADMDKAVYRELLAPTPIVTIFPCIPVAVEPSDKNVELGKRAMAAWMESDNQDEMRNYKDIIQSMQDNINDNITNDARAVKLTLAGNQYYKALNTILARFGAAMGVNVLDKGSLKKTITESGAEDATNIFGGLNYYTTAGTSITESGSHNFDKDMFGEMTNSVSDMMHKVTSVMQGFGVSTASVDQANQLVNDTINGVAKNSQGTQSKISRIIKGDKAIFPKVWMDSSMSRSYNLEFTFQTVYGDRMSIFKEVIVPLASLMALFLPRQTGISTYNSPFLVQVDCKGLFTLDTGYIESFSITKDVESMTAAGFCKKITVQMQVSDLYPLLMSSPTNSLLASNFGLSQFIDNMSMLSITDSFDRFSIGGQIRQAFYSTLMDVVSPFYAKSHDITTKVLADGIFTQGFAGRVNNAFFGK